jgi:hypothetical protein
MGFADGKRRVSPGPGGAEADCATWQREAASGVGRLRAEQYRGSRLAPRRNGRTKATRKSYNLRGIHPFPRKTRWCGGYASCAYKIRTFRIAI